jgi:hypothetical protein
MNLWKEFAIEPDLFRNYHLGSEILSGVGLEHGRIVGALPKKWAQRVRDVGREHNQAAQQLKLIEKLNELKAAIIPRDFAFDGGRPWRDQASECHRILPFDGIVINGTAPSCIDATLGLAGQQGWAHSRHLSIPRTASSLAKVLRPIICAAREMIIVDAYFNPSVALAQSKWLKPLRALAAQLTTDGRVTRFEVHALSSRNDPWDTGLFEQHCRNNLAPALPNGVALDAMVWKERDGGLQFHERLIVTGIGGVSIDPGVDEGSQGQAYDLRLLSKQEVCEKLEKFTQAVAPYDLLAHQRIIGIGGTS